MIRNTCLAVTVGLTLAVAPATAQREFGFDNTKPSGQPYLSPDETVKRFKVAPEFEVKLFAGEPQLVNPIAFTIDEKGRIWVVECFEYPKRTPKGKAPRDRIVILEDTDGDGACDKRTVFAEGKDFPVSEERAKEGLGAFDLASGIEVGHGGVFVGAPPYLWFVENKGDKPGKFERVLSGFGSQDTHETLNTFQWGPDGWLYGLHGVFTQSTVKPLDGPETRMNAAVWRYQPRTKKFEVFAEGTSNPWGLDWRNTDGQFILACCVIPHLYHMVPGGIYKRQAGSSFNPYAYGYIQEICDHTFHRESGWAHAGLISLDVPHMPEKYRNSVIFGSIHGCSVKQNVLKPNGSSFTASRGDDFLVSGDKNFRPINLRWGPNGDIYLIDWHDQNPCHQTKPDDWDYERGRVYRIQLKGTQLKKAADLARHTPAELVTLALSDHPYESRTALRLLAELPADGKATAFEALTPLGKGKAVLPPKILWTGVAIGMVRKDKVATFDPPANGIPDMPAEAVPAMRVYTESGFVTEQTVKGFAAVAAGVKLPQIRRELASAAVRLTADHDVTPILRALMARKEDANDPLIPHLVWVAYEKVLSGRDKPGRSPAEQELAWLAEQAPGNGFVRDQIVPKVMRRLVATGQAADLALCLKFVADVKDAGTREKALDGLAVALAGQTVDMPEGWAALQPELQKDARLAPFANKLAVSFRDPKAVARAMDVLRDSRQPEEARAEAVRQLTQLKPERVEALFVTILRQGFPPPVKLEAARGLGNFDSPQAAKDVLTLWPELPTPIRTELVNSLAGRRQSARLLLQALASKVVDRRDVSDNAIIRIQAFNDRELNAMIEKAWGRSRPTPKELSAQIDAMRSELARKPGSFSRGRKVFETQCAKCHRFDGAGAEVGPPLDGAGRDIEYLLANVLDPNRVIGAPYFIRQANTLDGQVLQGLLVEEDDLTLSLKVENGILRKVAKKDLDGPVKVLEKSMMPEGLGAAMTAEDFRDLIRYAMVHPFVTDWTIDGKPIAGGVGGLTFLAPPPKSDQPIVLEAKVTASSDLKTQLLVGCGNGYEVFLDGKPVGVGKGDKQPGPDRESFDIRLPKGEHTLRIVVKHVGVNQGLYARFRDPDRKLSYPEVGEKK
jgi:putative membrane-bound dehydrogenase-like protein